MFKQYPQVFVLFLLVLNLTTAEEEKVEEGGTGEERKDAIAKILSMDVFKFWKQHLKQIHCSLLIVLLILLMLMIEAKNLTL